MSDRHNGDPSYVDRLHNTYMYVRLLPGPDHTLLFSPGEPPTPVYPRCVGQLQTLDGKVNKHPEISLITEGV